MPKFRCPKICQSCVAQRSACLSATSVAAADADAVHHAVHLVAQLANQAAVHQLQLHVLALATDIKSAKVKLSPESIPDADGKQEGVNVVIRSLTVSDNSISAD